MKELQLKKQFQDITETIEAEKEMYLGKVIGALLGKPSTTAEEDRQHQITMLALSCIRIQLNLSLRQAGDFEHVDLLESDFNIVLEQVKSLDYWSSKQDQFISEAVDLIFAAGNIKKSEIQSILPKKYRSYNQAVATFKPDSALFKLCSVLFQYYLKEGWQEQKCHVARQMVALSREYNRSSTKLHRGLVVHVLAGIAETDQDCAIDICEAEKGSFRTDIEDDDTGNFYWFYGSLLHEQKKYTEAYNAFLRCYEIRQAVSGERDWFTVLTKRECSAISLYINPSPKQAENLTKLIDEIEMGCYPEANSDFKKQLEGKTLYVILKYYVDTNQLSTYSRYLKLYEQMCETYDAAPEHPLLQRRLAYNFRGAMEVERGNYLQAGQHFLTALHTELPAGKPEILTKVQIKSNLLLTYDMENDLDSFEQLFSEDILAEDGDFNLLSDGDQYRICTMWLSILMRNMIPLGGDEAEFVQEAFEQAYKSFQEGYENKLPDSLRNYAVFMVSAVFSLLSLDCLLLKQYQHYYNVLQRLEADADILGFNDLQKIILYSAMATLTWELKISGVEFYMQRCQELISSGNIVQDVKTEMLQKFAAIRISRGNVEQARCNLREGLDAITQVWHSAVRYCNDNRLMFCLLPAQIQVSAYYGIQRQIESVSVAYESVLRFKALASLAGRERNRIFRSSNKSQPLMEEIRTLQNRIAAAEVNALFRQDTGALEQDMSRLRELEAKAFTAFPQQGQFIKITFDKLAEIMPDNAAIVEYFLCSTVCGKRIYELKDIKDNDIAAFDMYLLCKRNGHTQLTRLTLKQADTILESAKKFVALLQKGRLSDNEKRRKEQLRNDLYRRLLGKAMPILNGVKRLYLAPDQDLINLPFEILGDDYGHTLEQQFEIVKMECGRDLLFASDVEARGAGSLIIGNPQYEISEFSLFRSKRKSEEEHSRTFSINVDSIKPLPFSGVEAQLISRICGVGCMTGKKATKYVLNGAKSCKNIHIATHGCYDITGEKDVLYASCLLFAGAKNWMKTGIEAAFFGNGILTADEISRMDLRSVEMVVLSSCLSGMHDTMLNKGLQGMVGSFAAAGVKYIVAHLWSANDFAAAVFMERFYKEYVRNGSEPPIALRQAKRYLAQITIEDLKRQGWFKIIQRSSEFSQEMKEFARAAEKLPGKSRPFENETYWGGFSCYQCR